MFWRRPKREPWDQAKADYDRVIRGVHGAGTLTLAIARMSYFVGYNVKSSGSGELLKSPDYFRMNGVLHEPGADEQHVSCELVFVDHGETDGAIGSCQLHQIEPRSRPKIPTRVEEKRMMLEAAICDPEAKYRYIAYDVMRDAAFSGDRFVHFTIATDKTDVEAAERQMRETGHGPSLRVHNLMVWPEVTLPKAPAWGRKRYWE